MNILIVGLGLIGGSYASGLTKARHSVYGADKDKRSVEFAKDKGYILNNDTDIELLIPKCEIIILCIYPTDIIEFLKKYQDLFTDKHVITDVCGIKKPFIYEAKKLSLNANYLSHHPMAGREKSSILFSDDKIFKNMNYLICPFDDTPSEIIDIIKRIGTDLGFGKITLIDPDKHDQMIAFTSQLTHAMAVSLVNSDKFSDTSLFIGDSYRDLTRIAMINENLWSELFMANKDNLLEKIESFKDELLIIQKALENNDRESLKKLFKKSTARRKEMEK